MRVSVIIPALNEEKNIEATLKAVRNQDYKGPIELIVADGHSTDKTVQISEKYANKVVMETTRTIAAGRNAGAKAARGDLLLYTDADTIVESAWVRKMVGAFKDPQVVAAFGMIKPIGANPIEKWMLTSSVWFAATFLNFLRMDYTYGNNMALRKSAFDKIGGFDIYLVTGEDTDIIKRIRKQGRVVFVPDAVAHYSIRRIRDWGYRKYLWFHTKNFFMTLIFGKPAKKYEAVGR